VVKLASETVTLASSSGRSQHCRCSPCLRAVSSSYRRKMAPLSKEVVVLSQDVATVARWRHCRKMAPFSQGPMFSPVPGRNVALFLPAWERPSRGDWAHRVSDRKPEWSRGPSRARGSSPRWASGWPWRRRTRRTWTGRSDVGARLPPGSCRGPCPPKSRSLWKERK